MDNITLHKSLVFVPKNVTNVAMLTYVLALLTCSMFFMERVMLWYWWIFGLVEVCTYFYFANRLTKDWSKLTVSIFERNLFWLAFFIRVIVMLFLYWFHNEMTGQPFMFSAADAKAYHDEAVWMSDTIREGHFRTYLDYKFSKGSGVSDAGYPMYLGIVYLLSGDSIIFARLLKCLWGALSCILLYRIAKSHFGEQVGRIAGILMMLESHFWIYGGMHLKETEMIFMMLLFIERADCIVRNKKFNVANIVILVLLIASLFTFRTALGLTSVFSLAMALMFSSKRIISWGNRVVFLLVLGITFLCFAGTRMVSEIERMWELKDDTQERRLSVIAETQSLAKYAGAAVFAPMIFTLPFPTMVETEGQETSRMLHGGMVTKNIMSFFCILALLSLIYPIFPNMNKWRDHVLIGSFLIAYLLILVFSAFAHADRFHMPALPLELLFSAYGISLLCIRKKVLINVFNWWLILLLIVIVGWNWFKLAGRGLI